MVLIRSRNHALKRQPLIWYWAAIVVGIGLSVSVIALPTLLPPGHSEIPDDSVMQMQLKRFSVAPAVQSIRTNEVPDSGCPAPEYYLSSTDRQVRYLLPGLAHQARVLMFLSARK